MYSTDEILKIKKTKGFSWNKLAENLPITGEALRVSFVRNSIDADYLEEICKVLGIYSGKSIKNNALEEPFEDYNKGVPYYDVDFTAGFLSVENNNKQAPDSYISHPFFKGCDYVVRASGQSMAKVICHGDAIGLRKVNNWQEFFPFGEIYAIVTHDGFRMIKIVTKGDSDDYFTLISKPTESKKNEFPPQQIRKDSILSMFKVQASSHLF